MKTLLTITDQDIDPSVAIVDPKEFYKREAARAVVYNDQKQVHLIKINVHGYHKLPGGGVEEGEDLRAALERELVEEIGCEVRIGSEVGAIIEYRSEMKWLQTSHCFVAYQVGAQQLPKFEQLEIDEGAECLLANNIDEAIALLESDNSKDYEAKFIKIRDLCLLRAAKDLI